ncbi:MAG: cysteine peptidase family C39 domain-containing protein [Nannocystaceae bacterium]|nr:cysteine peptidase family C39 domain-containing protein [bacterium]
MIATTFSIDRQPDTRSCGPTCLHAVYRHFGVELPLQALVDEIDQLDTGGTLAVQLGTHALGLGFDATIYTYNLHLFDPTWFHPGASSLAAKLVAQRVAKPDDTRLAEATGKYLTFLERGGQVRHQPLAPALLADRLSEGLPVLTGLSATYLYDAMREVPDDDRSDDVAGLPVGHFVVLHGIDIPRGTVDVADPWPGPGGVVGSTTHSTWRVLTAVALGVLTYDANLLVLRKQR